MTDDVLTAEEAARFLHMGQNKLHRLSVTGAIPCRDTNPGGQRARRIYSRAALLKWAEGEVRRRG